MSKSNRNLLEPIIRQSTSQPQNSSKSKRDQAEWNSRFSSSDQLTEYNAINDPYCPHTHTYNFKKHLEKQSKLEKSEILLSKSQTSFQIDSTMKNMDRPQSAPYHEKQLQHLVKNENFAESGITYSSEPRGKAAEGLAELDVLKSILAREGYLTRLYKSIRKVEKKFKPEIADILDLVRVSSISVVESIEKWRDIKVFTIF